MANSMTAKAKKVHEGRIEILVEVEISEGGIAQTSAKPDWRSLAEWKCIKSAKLTGPKTVTVLADVGPSGWGYVWKVKTGSAREFGAVHR